jgi:hypothetical protein
MDTSVISAMIRDLRKRLAHPEHEFFKPMRSFVKSRQRLILIAAGALLFFLRFRSIILLIALGFVVMVWDYILHTFHIPIHMDFLFFASILVTRDYGFQAAAIFALIAGNLPEILSGSFDITDMFSTIPVILLCFISTYFMDSSIIVTGIIFSLAFAVLEFFTALLFAEPPHKVFIEPLAVLALNVFLFLNLSVPILDLLG